MEQGAFEYSARIPLMAYAPGTGSPIAQNTAGFPAGISGNVPIGSNVMAGVGPDPFRVPGVWDWLNGPAPVPAEQPESGDPLKGTLAGDYLKRGAFYFVGLSLIWIGLIYLLWGPGKTVVKAAAKIA